MLPKERKEAEEETESREESFWVAMSTTANSVKFSRNPLFLRLPTNLHIERIATRHTFLMGCTYLKRKLTRVRQI